MLVSELIVSDGCCDVCVCLLFNDEFFFTFSTVYSPVNENIEEHISHRMILYILSFVCVCVVNSDTAFL